jgi:hypothetical protein
MDKLMAAFQLFFQEHSRHWLERFQYKEAGPQLLLQAFLLRVDLPVLWPLKPAQDEKPDWTRWQGPVKKGKLQVSYLLAFLSSINYTIKDVRTQTNSYIPKMAEQVKRSPG